VQLEVGAQQVAVVRPIRKWIRHRHAALSSDGMEDFYR